VSSKYLYILLSFSLTLLWSCEEKDSTAEQVIEVIEPIVFSNATNLNKNDQIEIVTWNIKRFPQDNKYTVPYVRSLLNAWDADIYLFQEIEDNNSLKKMVDEMNGYSYILSDAADFALVYKREYVTYNSKNELWSNTSSRNDGDSDYTNNAQYQFAGRSPMENYITWKSDTKSIDLYLINVHYKCCGDDQYDNMNPEDETTRRHNASLLLTDYIVTNRPTDNVIVVGDFNNVGEQNILNPAISPFIDIVKYDFAKHFKMVDINILTGSENNYSWQGWTSSYSPAHFDHIIITKPLFTFSDNSTIDVINTPIETGFSLITVSNTISDHRPVFFSFTID
tara:strand:+ start:1525 stop:2535 length:1011 start_codon:yes stop_codon:yes gene_type:complete